MALSFLVVKVRGQPGKFYSFVSISTHVILTARVTGWLFKNMYFNDLILSSTVCFPGGASGKEPACQCGRYERHRFDPWVGKIPWRKAQQPTPVFLPGESLWTEEPGGL